MLPAPRIARSQDPAGGTWTIVTPTLRTGASTIYDPVRHRMILFGGNDDPGALGFRNDVWALSLAGPPVWTRLEPTGPQPSPSQGHTAIYDPVRDRMIVYGGYYQTRDCPGCVTVTHANEGVWTLSISGTPQWTRFSPGGAAASIVSRSSHSAIYDPIGDRMIVYGGSPGPDEAWSLSLGDSLRWTQIIPSGTTPGGRLDHAAVFDPIRGRMLVFGCNGNCGVPGEVWDLSLVGQPAWTRLLPEGAASVTELRHGAAIYDPLHDRVVLRSQDPAIVWALSLNGSSRWSQLQPSGLAPAQGGAAIYDQVGRRMILYGADAAMRGDLSALSLAGEPAWQEFYPPRRTGPSLVYDAPRCRLVMFGGYTGSVGQYLDDVWTLSMGPRPVWSKLAVAPGPAPRYLHAAVYDPVRERMIVFGGTGARDYPDLWALSLKGDPVWTRIQPQLLGPSDARNKALVYVPTRDELWLFGSSPDDVWYVGLGADPVWRTAQTAGSAPGPSVAFYEPTRDRLLACGSGGVYALSLGDIPAWSTIVPPGIDWSRTIYDASRHRLLRYHDPTWQLDLADSSWAQVATGGPPLSLLAYTTVVDVQNDRAISYGSQDNSLRSLGWVPAGQESLLAGAEVLADGVALGDGSVFTSAPRFSARIPGVACLDPARCVVRLDGVDVSPPASAEPEEAIELEPPLLSEGDHRLEVRLVSFGVRRVIGSGAFAFGFRATPAPNDRLWLGEATATPNPARGVVRLGFRLTRPAGYAIDLFDLSGRRVARLAQGSGVAGWNSYQWDGTIEGQRAGSGFYLYQVVASDGSATVRARGRVLFLR